MWWNGQEGCGWKGMTPWGMFFLQIGLSLRAVINFSDDPTKT